MKKTASLIASLLFATSIFAGCTSAPPDAGSAKTQPAKPAEQKAVNQPSKDQFGRFNFTQVGQKIELEDGSTVELVKIKEVNEKVQIKPIEVTIKNIKIFKWSGLSEDSRQQIGALSGLPSVPETFHYIQVLYDAENKSDKNVDFAGLEKVVLSNGEQLDAMLNNILLLQGSTQDPQFFGKVKQERAVGLVIKGKPEEIKSVKLIFSNSVDPTTYETITSQQQVEYSF